MILTVNLANFYSDFLNVLIDANKEGKTAVFVKDEQLYSITTINNNSIFFYNTYNPLKIENKLDRINFNTIKLKTALTCIKDANIVNLYIENNKMSYKDDFLKFDIRLLNDSVVAVPNFNINTLENMKFDFSMTLTRKLINELKRGDAFCGETNKFYFSIIKEKPVFTFGDKTNEHTNEIAIALDAEYSGMVSESIFDSSILRMLFKTNNDVLMQMNDKVLAFTITTDNSKQVFLTTKLKK